MATPNKNTDLDKAASKAVAYAKRGFTAHLKMAGKTDNEVKARLTDYGNQLTQRGKRYDAMRGAILGK